MNLWAKSEVTWFGKGILWQALTVCPLHVIKQRSFMMYGDLCCFWISIWKTVNVQFRSPWPHGRHQNKHCEIHCNPPVKKMTKPKGLLENTSNGDVPLGKQGTYTPELHLSLGKFQPLPTLHFAHHTTAHDVDGSLGVLGGSHIWKEGKWLHSTSHVRTAGIHSACMALRSTSYRVKLGKVDSGWRAPQSKNASE